MKITIASKDVQSISQDDTKEYTTIILHEGCNGLEGIIQVHNSCVVYIDDEQLTIES
jgi:hypothetical protein